MAKLTVCGETIFNGTSASCEMVKEAIECYNQAIIGYAYEANESGKETEYNEIVTGLLHASIELEAD